MLQAATEEAVIFLRQLQQDVLDFASADCFAGDFQHSTGLLARLFLANTFLLSDALDELLHPKTLAFTHIHELLQHRRQLRCQVQWLTALQSLTERLESRADNA